MTSHPEERFASYFLLGPGRENHPAEVARWKKPKKEKQVGNVRGCCSVVYNASGRAFAVISYEEVFFFFVSIPSSRPPRIHKWLRSKCMSEPAFGAKGGVCFAARDTLVRSESCVLPALVANG